MNRNAAVALCVPTLLTACMTPTSSKPATVSVETVMAQIKSDLGRYQKYAVEHADDVPQNNACKGKVNFTITAVKVTLTTITERSTNAQAGAEVPIGIFTVGASASSDRSTKQSQTLQFGLVPSNSNVGVRDASAADGGFANALINLRESLLESSNQSPCFTFGEEDKQDNSVEFGFNVSRTTTAGAKVSFLIFSIGGSAKRQEQATNTVKISFKAVGEGLSTVPM